MVLIKSGKSGNDISKCVRSFRVLESKDNVTRKDFVYIHVRAVKRKRDGMRTQQSFAESGIGNAECLFQGIF